MKTFQLTPRAGMVKATKEDLMKSGKPFTGIVLRENDIITFPIESEMDPSIEPLGAGKVVCLNVHSNGEPTWLAYGAMLKTPHGNHAEDFLKEFPVNAQICQVENNISRTALLAGKAIRVSKVFVGPKPIFTQNAAGKYEMARKEDGSIATQPGNFPVFEWTTRPE